MRVVSKLRVLIILLLNLIKKSMKELTSLLLSLLRETRTEGST